MHFLELDEFLKKFKNKNIKYTTQYFYNNTIVKIGDKIVPLNKYIEKKKRDPDDVYKIYESIIDKHSYLKRFYNKFGIYNKQNIPIFGSFGFAK